MGVEEEGKRMLTESSVRNAVQYTFYAEPEAGRLFDAWLAKVKADAWDEGARDYYNAPLGAVNPHRGRGDEQ